ncbi:hypothetical protein N7510_009836 [Penicillium lagena]|uniref:uncharacterized protein n=1 Tax=Penicillium lagena TaxID=94218 RepID=UPI00253F7274|nr:uncharacterized protein N7510_009836 [Penicillium lagena]KAJ5604682.1 hypothetical protein N7510_009836 [Penicillium lagena]
MPKTSACMPCAKRKVRCDRQEPCSHCKRRKRDDCTYPDVSSETRIKYLEELVRSLGGSPESEESSVNTGASTTALVPLRKRTLPVQHDQNYHRRTDWARSAPNNDPVIVEEGGERVYLEAIGALQNIIQFDDTIDLASEHPTPEKAAVLWTACNRNVIPLVKILFQWELDQMRSTALSPNATYEFLPQEHALFFAIYLNTVTSLSEDECLESLGQPKKSLLSKYREFSENAFARADFLGRSEVALVQASIFYISASIDELSTRSLWSFIGVVIRHAERLGLHRDGILLNLSPAETEKRRRIWWQLQHLDIILAVRSGSISLVLMADWDVKLPLNIEDEDISPTSTDFPPERKGLTSMSFCLWTYYVLETQRSFRRPDGCRVGGSWQADRSLSGTQKEAFMDELEKGINVKFIQYCDPVVPLELLILIMSRAFMWDMRRLILHSDEIMRDASEPVDERGKKVLTACARCLEYDVYLHSQKTLERFYWRATTFFSWHAFVYVIGDASRYGDGSEETWELLGKLYLTNSHLSNFADDRRKPRAADMILSVWQTYEKSFSESRHTKPQRPDFLKQLEALLMAGKVLAQNTDHQSLSSTQGPVMDASYLPEEAEKIPADYSPMNLTFDLDPTDIDWSFWSNWK